MFTDARLVDSAYLATTLASLSAAGVDSETYSEVRVEPTDGSVLDAARFVQGGRFDGAISVGGGSVMDTAKAALVYARYPASFTTYFAPPVGEGSPIPGPVLPHIACPTTSGTGSEVTGLSVIRIESLDTKFVLAGRAILPDEAVIDPACAETLPALVVASTGFDLLSHAIECYTARAYTRWPHVDEPGSRPMIQGANPWSDLHAREALRIVGRYLERGVADAADREARDSLMWAASLAGMAFGNCGTHIPHALSYAITNLVREFETEDYPVPKPFIPHGMSVIVNSPAVFRFTAEAAPERHLDAAQHLGGETRGATPDDAGEVVARCIVDLMRDCRMPNGIGEVGFGHDDAGALAASAIRQRRAIVNSPRETSEADLVHIFENAVTYW